MAKNLIAGILLLICCTFFSGCATMHGSWSSVNALNTRDGYMKFAKEYPSSEFAKEAQKRADDPDYAFLATCRIGTKKAVEGYLASYPSSDYVPMVRAYDEFLKETAAHDLKSYKQFIAQHPNHSFITEARISTPLLWLKERGEKVGVIVNIKQQIFKGILGGGQGDKEKARQKVYEKLKTELGQEGVQSVLLDNVESGKAVAEKIDIAVIADYAEVEYPKSSPPISGGLYKSPVVDAIAWDTAGALSGIIWKPAQEIVSIGVKGVNGETKYYSNFSGLASSDGTINRVEALKAIGESPSPATAMLALKGNPSDQGISQWEKDLLSQIKDADTKK